MASRSINLDYRRRRWMSEWEVLVAGPRRNCSNTCSQRYPTQHFALTLMNLPLSIWPTTKGEKWQKDAGVAGVAGLHKNNKRAGPESPPVPAPAPAGCPLPPPCYIHTAWRTGQIPGSRTPDCVCRTVRITIFIFDVYWQSDMMGMVRQGREEEQDVQRILAVIAIVDQSVKQKTLLHTLTKWRGRLQFIN